MSDLNQPKLFIKVWILCNFCNQVWRSPLAKWQNAGFGIETGGSAHLYIGRNAKRCCHLIGWLGICVDKRLNYVPNKVARQCVFSEDADTPHVNLCAFVLHIFTVMQWCHEDGCVGTQRIFTCRDFEHISTSFVVVYFINNVCQD